MVKQDNWISRYTWTSSAVITAIIFTVFLLVSTTLFNSGDDTFLMYTMGGGYGEEPTNLLHYNHIWHPALGWVGKILFKQFHGINWYTVILLLFHYAGSSSILYILLKRCKTSLAGLLFILLFLFTETRQLLSLSFTGAAFTAATGSMCLLIHQLQQKEIKYSNIIFGILLFIASGLLRLQVAWLVIILSGAVAVTLLSRKQFLYWGLISFFSTAVLWGLNKQHEDYYTRNITSWKQDEKFRQALFYAYNRQLTDNIPAGIFKDSTEQSLFFAGFLYDTAVFSTAHTDEISHKITRTRSIFNKGDRAGLYWFFIEMRVYLLLLAALVLMLIVQGRSKRILYWLLPFLAFIAVHSYLFIFLKITIPLHLGLLLYLLLALMMQFKKEDKTYPDKKIVSMAPLLLITAASAWMAVRVYKENDMNKERYSKFLCAMKELNSDPQKLMVATDDAFPINYFYIWNTPAAYPATNFLYKDRLITRTYLHTLKRYNISSLKDALMNDNRVFLLGNKLTSLENYADPAVLTNRVPGYQCLEVYQLKQK